MAYAELRARAAGTTGTSLTVSGAEAVDLSAVVADAAAGIGVVDRYGRLVSVNPALATLLGRPVGWLLGRDLVQLVEPDDAAELAERVGALLAGQVGVLLAGPPQRACLEVRVPGAGRWLLLALSGLRPDAGCAELRLVVVAQDVTEQRELAGQWRHRAFHDPLTGLPNRSLFADRVEELFRTSRPATLVGLCFLDLDAFKSVNDKLGYAVGDRLLVAVAERLRRGLAAQGHLLARLGGDEFVVLVNGAGGIVPGTAAEVAGHLLQVLAAPFRLGEHELRISASIGVVERAVAETTYEDLLRAADLRMRRAKTAGKARWSAVDLDTARPAPRPSPVVRAR
jgi:diguanylate cyclase (GGDEF)-like protein/PAS domain S-box-containing protein